MRRYTAATTALLALLLTAGCGGGDEDDGKGVEKAGHGPTSKPGAEKPESALDLPARARVLVGPVSGTDDAKLPGFRVEKDVYTVYATCVGKGRMTIVYGNEAKDRPTPVSCDGPATIGRVYTDARSQSLAVEVSGGNPRWTIAVVAGAHGM